MTASTDTSIPLRSPHQWPTRSGMRRARSLCVGLGMKTGTSHYSKAFLYVIE